MPMPGPLSSVHTGIADCTSCHATVHAKGGNWLTAAFGAVDVQSETTKCLTCHKLDAATANNPHGLAVSVLAAMTKQASARPAQSRPAIFDIQSALLGGAGYGKDRVACATCHVEHNGHDVNLKDVFNETCQTCHMIQFSSLSKGHPEFTSFPYDRRTRIIFDHNSHFDRHFPKSADKQPPSLCTSCHVPSLRQNGRFMVSKPFEQMCSSCHLEQINGLSRASGPKGVVVFSVPGLDIETLHRRGIAIGAWPEFSEAPLTPFTKSLLLLRGLALSDLTVFAKIDPLDLAKATDADLQAVARVAWANKELINDMIRSDPRALSEKLVTGLSGKSDRQKAIQLFANLSRDVLEGMARDWLPNLAQEVVDHRAGKTVWGALGKPKINVKTKLAPQTSASEDAANKSKKLDQSNILGTLDQSDILGKTAPSDALGKPDISDILGAKNQSNILGTPDQSDILGKTAPSDALGKPDISDTLGAKNQSDILGSPARPSGLDVLGGTPVETVSKAAKLKASNVPFDTETWASLGGWYRKNFSVLYRPVSHKDGFLKGWLDFTGADRGTGPLKNITTALFTALTHNEAQGQCIKCHSIDRTDSGALSVNWHEFDGAGVKGTDYFSHQPHFALQGKNGCIDCHQRNPRADTLSTYKAFDTSVHQSSFKQMEKSLCASCHIQQAAGDGCTMCHRYHADGIRTPLLITRVPGN